jgi:hypothetical protein
VDAVKINLAQILQQRLKGYKANNGWNRSQDVKPREALGSVFGSRTEPDVGVALSPVLRQAFIDPPSPFCQELPGQV